MKDFMIKLYSNENFPIILFSIIGILLLLFIITLILALNDTKKKKESIVNENKLDDELKDSKEGVNNKIVIEDEPIVKENENKVEEKPVIEDFSFDDIVLPNTSKVEEESIKEYTTQSNLDINKVVNEENIELPKVNEKVNEDNNFSKVIDESSILDVKSLNDIPEEEYRIK